MSTSRSENLRPLLVGIADAQRLLGISRSAVYALIASGRLPRRKLGRSVRFALADLEAIARGE